MPVRCGGAGNGALDRIHHALYVTKICDPALRLTAAVFPDFAARYPSIAALSLNLGIDVMCQKRNLVHHPLMTAEVGADGK